MNTLVSIPYIAGAAIAAIVMVGLSPESKAATKKPNSRVAEKPEPTRQSPVMNAREMRATQAAKKLTPTQKTKMIALLNDGTASELESIRGIGKSRAAALTKARPFKSVAQLINIRGIGNAVYSDLLAHAKSLTVRRASSSSSKKSPSASSNKTKSPKSKSR
jgi:DNA uptake protein ComE-like DNA-binding protein